MKKKKRRKPRQPGPEMDAETRARKIVTAMMADIPIRTLKEMAPAVFPDWWAAVAAALTAERIRALEDAAKECKGVIVCEKCFQGMASILPRIAERIRALRGAP